jgi:hypothetical protein
MIPFTKSVLAFLLLLSFGKNTFSQDLAQLASPPIQNLTWMPQGTDSISMIKVIDSLPNSNQEMVSFHATCFCVVSYNNLTNQHNATGVCLNLREVINHSYGGLNPQSEANRNDCNARCTNAAVALSAGQKQEIANCACGANVGNGTPIRAYSAVGVKAYKTAQQIGVLVNTPAVTNTTCTCPTGWYANAPITPNSKWNKALCGPMTATLAPPNNTQLGTWGFTWDNYIYVWGTAANGGALKCTTEIVTPKSCKLQ